MIYDVFSHKRTWKELEKNLKITTNICTLYPTTKTFTSYQDATCFMRWGDFLLVAKADKQEMNKTK